MAYDKVSAEPKLFIKHPPLLVPFAGIPRCLQRGWVHFLPAIIANHRNHRNKWFILLLNIFLGWTILVWIALVIWSLNNDIKN